MSERQEFAGVVAWCLHEAAEHDLPAHQMPRYILNGVERQARERRPDRLEMHAWWQTWPNTSLGMGGLAGQAVTAAVTTVVVDAEAAVAAIYVNRHHRGNIRYDQTVAARVADRKIITGRHPNGEPADA